MALIEYNIFGEKRDKVQTAIDRLRAFEPKEGYYVADSGGKDSSCVVKLCEMAGVKFDATTTRRRLTRHSLYASSGSIIQQRKSKNLSTPCEN